MAAFNACITVGYVAGAAVKGITLDSLEIKTRGELDLRGFLGLSDAVAPGYESVDYEVRIKGNGTPEQFEEIHQAVMKTSPNYFNISRPIRLLRHDQGRLTIFPGASPIPSPRGAARENRKEEFDEHLLMHPGFPDIVGDMPLPSWPTPDSFVPAPTQW